MTDLGVIDLGRRLEEYLRIRRSLGFKLERDGKLLAQFIGYLHDQGTDTITLEQAVAWVGLPGGGRGWLAFRMSVVRGFAAYLHTLDPVVPVPPARTWSPPGRTGRCRICTPTRSSPRWSPPRARCATRCDEPPTAR